MLNASVSSLPAVPRQQATITDIRDQFPRTLQLTEPHQGLVLRHVMQAIEGSEVWLPLGVSHSSNNEIWGSMGFVDTVIVVLWPCGEMYVGGFLEQGVVRRGWISSGSWLLVE